MVRRPWPTRGVGHQSRLLEESSLLRGGLDRLNQRGIVAAGLLTRGLTGQASICPAGKGASAGASSSTLCRAGSSHRS